MLDKKNYNAILACVRSLDKSIMNAMEDHLDNPELAEQVLGLRIAEAKLLDALYQMTEPVNTDEIIAELYQQAFGE